MAGIAKRLRPRIVVPICVGSNPTTRPIKYLITRVIRYFIIWCFWDLKNTTDRKVCLGSSDL